MRLEKIDNEILIYDKERYGDIVLYSSKEDKSKYKRRALSRFEDFLRDSGEIGEADLLKSHLCKMLKVRNIPKLIPTNNYAINVELRHLVDTIDDYVKEYGLNLDPDFQRGHVWTPEQRVAYVEFVLQGGRSNPIFLNHEGWMKDWKGEMVIVDGKQRLTSLLMFLRDEFPVFTELDAENIGFYASELDFVPNDIIIAVNDLDSREKVLRWYLEINRGNVVHSGEDIKRVEDMLEHLQGKKK